MEVFAAARVMGRVRGLAALEGGCSGACSLPHLAALAYKISQAAEDQEHSSGICFLMKVEQEIKIGPAENVRLKWDEDPGSSLSLGALKMISPPLGSMSGCCLV